MMRANAVRAMCACGMALAWLLYVSAAALMAQDGPAATQPATQPSTAPAQAGPAQPSKNKAWVSGTITDADGKPISGLVVRAEKNEPRDMSGATGTGMPREYRVTTDEKGSFLIKEMDVTHYLLIAGNSDIGWIYQEIPVAAGKETKLGTLKMTKLN